ncbi:MAG: LamG-like jellyroll fold domain-containing protein [Candidatus Nanoarchaeia archaeon]|jgi:hypothetical protein
MVSGTFVVQGPTINSIADSPDPLVVGQKISFSVDWTWPQGNVDIYVCSTNDCNGLTGCGGYTYASETDVSANPKTLRYLTESTGIKTYYVFVFDHADPSIASTDNGESGTFDVNLTNLYLHFKDFRHNINPTDYTSMWSFYEGVGTTVYDKNITTANNLNLNDITWTLLGRFGRAITFNGTSSYATTNDVSDYATDTLGSISVWFKLTELPTTNQTILSISDADTNLQTYLRIYADYTNQWITAELVTDGTTQWSAHTTTDVNFESYIADYNQIIITQDGNEPKIYINNTEDTTITTSTNTTKWLKAIITDATNKASELTIGAIANNSTYSLYFKGRVDDTRVYNYVLDSTDRSNVYSISTLTTGTDCAITDRELNVDKIYNKVQVLGNNNISSSIQEDVASQNIYGLRELTYTDRSIYNTTDADEVATNLLNRYKDPSEFLTIEVVKRDFNQVIGDIIRITDINTGLSGDEFRITAIRRRYGNDGDRLIYELENI